MYAIIKTGGKQYKAEPGKYVKVEKVEGPIGSVVEFDAMMIVDGQEILVGKPVLETAKVTGKIIEHGKDKKIIVYKYKAKKDFHKKQGHRQPYTKVEITSIDK